MDNGQKYICEIKQVKQTKAVSLDNVYSATFVTDNPEILDLGKLPPDTLVELTIKISNG